MSNRVEDLERQVAELQAAVNGLTEELVEMKERVRQVEDAQEVSVAADAAESAEPAQSESTDAAAEESKATGGERRTHSDDHVEVVERTDDGPAADDAGTADSDSGGSEGDDVLVPRTGRRRHPTPRPPRPGSDAEEKGDEESDSDIIVA